MFNKGKKIKQIKLVLNSEEENKHLEVVIAEIRRIGNKTAYMISFGGDKTGFIIGEKEWDKFVDLVMNLNWDLEDTWVRPIKLIKKSRFDK
tara:strand:- start:553 stop:825 length:273 start_codon:yes stop_codon:yes gene_type:complete